MLPCRPLSTPADPHRSEPALEAPMAALDVVLVPALSDNYVYLLHDSDTGATAVVDPGEAAPVEAALAERGWTLSQIVNTHHHHDHVGGNRSEEHTSELQSLMRISYAVFCLKKNIIRIHICTSYTQSRHH